MEKGENYRLSQNREYFELGCVCIDSGKVSKLTGKISNLEAVRYYEKHCTCSRNYIPIDQRMKKFLRSAISFEVARNLTTERLLTYYKKYRYIQFHSETEEPVIISYFDEIRKILNSREHIE